MDEDGGNVTQIAPMNIGSALHPTPLRRRPPAVQQPRVAGPARRPHVGHLVDLARRPPLGAGGQRLPQRPGVPLHDPALQHRPGGRRLLQPQQQRLRRALSPAGRRRRPARRASTAPSRTRTPPSSRPSAAASPIRSRWRSRRAACTRSRRSPHGNDEAAPIGAGGVRGSASSPIRAARRTTTCWSSGRRGRATTSTGRPRTPYYDAGLYLIPGGNIVNQPQPAGADQERSATTTRRGRAPVVPYSAVHGVAEPAQFPWLPNDGTAARRSCRPARRTGWSAPAASTSARASPASCRRGPTPSTASTPSTPPRTARAATGSGRAPTPASTTTATSGRSASSAWSRTRTAATAPTAARAAARCFFSHAMREAAHPRRDPAAQDRRRRPADPRSRGQSRHQLPGQGAGRLAVHLPDPRPQRHGAQHGADLAPGAPRRGAQRLRRLPRAQPAAARLRHHRRGAARLPGRRSEHDDAAAHQGRAGQSRRAHGRTRRW